MWRYLGFRILLFPITLFAILLVNFVILNLAPGDPTELLDGGKTGDIGRVASVKHNALDDPFFQFREHFGLTLPILFNNWPSISQEKLLTSLKRIEQEKIGSIKHKAQLRWGDRARFLMPKLYLVFSDPSLSLPLRRIALNLFVRGGLRSGHFGDKISKEDRAENSLIETSNRFFLSLHASKDESAASINEKAVSAKKWMEERAQLFPPNFSTKERVRIFFFETRFSRYFSRLIHLDFGTLRSDPTKEVTSEVVSRLKYSFTLAIIPMVASFALAQIFGMLMAFYENKFIDLSLNTFFLILYAIPVFVLAPFLIEKVALGHHIPFTNIAIPISGFQSELAIYEKFSTLQRLGDIILHLAIPLTCLLYLMVAMQAKLARTAFLEAMRQDYVKTAKAKGLSMSTILIKHVGRNAAVTSVTALASSVGVILGGSLIVETVFNIHGFGRFFYEAILARDYNVILFSAIAGSALSLIGYLAEDIAYMLLDPRVRMGDNG